MTKHSNLMPQSVTQAAQNIIASNCQLVLFCDTCSILDIVRWERENWHKNTCSSLPSNQPVKSLSTQHSRLPFFVSESEIQRLQDLLLNNTTAFVISQEIYKEYNKHAHNIQNKSQQAIVESNMLFNKILNDARMNVSSPPSINMNGVHFVTHTKKIMDDLISKSIVIDDSNFHGSANTRVLAKLAPAQEGKKSFGDCLIVETLLALRNELQAGGFKGKIVFVSSNTKDFQQKDLYLAPYLQNDFGNTITYAKDWASI